MRPNRVTIESLPAPIRCKVMNFIVHGIAKPKERARLGKWGNWYTPKDTESFEASVNGMASIASAMFRMETGKPWDREGRYAVHSIAYYPDAKTRDVDNVSKSLLDGMQGPIFLNDNKVKATFCTHVVNDPHPRVDILIRKMENFTELAQRTRRVFLMDEL